MPKFKTQYNGSEIEVDIEGVVPVAELGSNYVPKSAHDQEVGKWKRLAAKVKSDDDLLGDAEFKTKALASWGINPDGKGQASAEQVAAMQETWRSQHLNPVQEELKQAREQVSSLLSNGLNMELIDAARSIGVRDEFLTPLKPGATPPIVSILQGVHRFAYNPDTAAHAVQTADGSTFEYSAKPSPTNPYKGVAEAVVEWSKDKQASYFLKDQRQRIGGEDGRPITPSPSGSRIISNNPIDIGRNLEALAKGEATVVLNSGV